MASGEELDNKGVDAIFDYGQSLVKERKFIEAEEAFRKVLKLDPKHAKAHGDLGTVLSLQGKYGEAEAACRTAIELNT